MLQSNDVNNAVQTRLDGVVRQLDPRMTRDNTTNYIVGANIVAEKTSTELVAVRTLFDAFKEKVIQNGKKAVAYGNGFLDSYPEHCKDWPEL